MGFKKTETGNVVYDFDFMPTKLVPLSVEETGGPYEYYAVEDDNGHRAPVVFPFQGERYKNYGCAFGLIASKDEVKTLGTDICVCANALVTATLASLFEKSESGQEDFDPWDATGFAKEGTAFRVLRRDDAIAYIKERGIPLDGGKVMQERTR